MKPIAAFIALMALSAHPAFAQTSPTLGSWVPRADSAVAAAARLPEHTSWFHALGAACFGALIGWYLYFTNRYRTGEVNPKDLVTIVGVIGGAAILKLFPAGSDLFAAYGIGLFLGFFGYLAVLCLLVWWSDGFTKEWFLDGRRKTLPKDFEIQPGVAPTTHTMLRGAAETLDK